MNQEAGPGGYDIGYASVPCFWGAEPGSLVRRGVELLGGVQGKKVLDAGCGEGKNAAFLAGQGAAVDAVDISEWALRNAASAWPHQVADGVTFAVGDVRDTPLTGPYDIVVLYGLLHCVPGHTEKRQLVERLKRLTAPDGLHIVCALNDRLDGFTEGHIAFVPDTASHCHYVQLYGDWVVTDVSDSDLTESHPPNYVPHTHAVTRFFASPAHVS